MASAAHPQPAPPLAPAEDDLDFLSAATLTRRAARPVDASCGPAASTSSSSRAFYFRPNADCAALIEAASRRLAAEPGNVRARLIRARALTSKGERKEKTAASVFPGAPR
jgi:hypothetical protein